MITLAAAPVPTLIASAEASEPILIAVPADRIVADPFKDVRPVTSRVPEIVTFVKLAGPPAAITCASFKGVIAVLSSVPAIASAVVAN